MANAKELMDFIKDLEDRGLLAVGLDSFDYEKVIWEYLGLKTTFICNDNIKIVEEYGADWNIWQNLKAFEAKEQSIWKTQSAIRHIMLKVDLSKKERRQLNFIANQESSRL